MYDSFNFNIAVIYTTYRNILSSRKIQRSSRHWISETIRLYSMLSKKDLRPLIAQNALDL